MECDDVELEDDEAFGDFGRFGNNPRFVGAFGDVGGHGDVMESGAGLGPECDVADCSGARD